MSGSPSKVSIAGEGLRNLHWIVVARYTGISFVASLVSNEKFSFPIKRNRVAEVNRLLD